MKDFKKIIVKDFLVKPFELLIDEWALVTAKKKDNTINTMVAGWGGFGTAWNLPAVSIMLRQQRFTREFIEDSNEFSLTFFDQAKYKKDLSYLGSISGREQSDKITKTILTPSEYKNIPYFLEAHTVIYCKSIFNQVLTPEHFLDDRVDRFYKGNDLHHLYIGEVIDIFQK